MESDTLSIGIFSQETTGDEETMKLTWNDLSVLVTGGTGSFHSVDIVVYAVALAPSAGSRFWRLQS